MTVHGPWIQPADQWSEAGSALKDNLVLPIHGNNDADAVTQTGPFVALPQGSTAGWTYWQVSELPQVLSRVAIPASPQGAGVVPSSLPPHAVGYEYENTTGIPTNLGPTQLIMQTSGPIDRTLAAATGAPSSAFITADVYEYPATTAVNFLSLSSVTVDPLAVVTARPFLAAVPASQAGYAVALADVGSLPALAGVPGHIGVQVQSVIKAAVDGAPSAPIGVASGLLVGALSIQLWIRPARYRFLYETLPALRQFPRDDALAGVQRPRREATSVQASTRQGWSGTYR